AGDDILELDLVVGATLAGLHGLGFHHRPELAIEFNDHAGAHFVSSDLGHAFFRSKERAGSNKAFRPCHPWAANSALKRATAFSGAAAGAPTPAETARKSAPAAIKGAALSSVMPPMATQGTSMVSVHQDKRSGSARVSASLVAVG